MIFPNRDRIWNDLAKPVNIFVNFLVNLTYPKSNPIPHKEYRRFVRTACISFVTPKDKKGFYSRFLVKALPEGLFKYTSKSRAFWRSVKAMAVLIRQGLYFVVWGLFP